MKTVRSTYWAAASAVVIILVFGFMKTPSLGKKLFLGEGCINCHSFKGQGGMGTDLTFTAQKRSTFWIMKQLKNPRQNNPDSRMPEYGHLTLFERYSLARYIRN